jgi:hypothetical protein
MEIKNFEEKQEIKTGNIVKFYSPYHGEQKAKIYDVKMYKDMNEIEKLEVEGQLRYKELNENNSDMDIPFDEAIFVKADIVFMDEDFTYGNWVEILFFENLKDWKNDYDDGVRNESTFEYDEELKVLRLTRIK